MVNRFGSIKNRFKINLNRPETISVSAGSHTTIYPFTGRMKKNKIFPAKKLKIKQMYLEYHPSDKIISTFSPRFLQNK